MIRAASNDVGRGSEGGGPTLALPALIVLGAIAVRAALAFLGGQNYSSDELVHFDPALKIAPALLSGSWDQALVAALKQEHHFGFRLPSTIVALAAGAVAPGRTWVLAFFLSFSSVAVIVLVYALARRRGAGRREATIAMLFAATATSLTYFARHLMPYDTGLAIDLLALWLALRGDGFRRGMAIGAVGCFGFITYYAYLAVATLAAAVYVLRQHSGVVRRALGVTTGVAVILAPFEIATVTRGATLDWVPPFHVALWRFLHGAPETWGSSYAEGWWVPVAYLWHVEHAVVLTWVVLTAAGCVYGSARSRWWGAVGFGLYAWLALHSTVLHEAVVLGRFVRQIVPFLCLGAAAGLTEVVGRARHCHLDRRLTVAALAAFALLVSMNLWPVVIQRFPQQVDQLWNGRYGPHAYDQTIIGPDGKSGSGRYVALNVRPAGSPWPVLGVRDDGPVGCVLEAYPHPLAWPGYQYEGFTAQGRAAIRARPYLMALLDREASQPCTEQPGR